MKQTELRQGMGAQYDDLFVIITMATYRDELRIFLKGTEMAINSAMDAFFKAHPEIDDEESELIENAIYGWETQK